MKSYRVGLTALVTFLATISTPLIVGSVAVFSSPPTSVQAQDTSKTSADQLIQQGITQYKQGKLDAAIQSWQQALKIYQQLKERQGEATALGNLGAAYLAMGNYKQAIASLQPLLPITQALGDRNGEARALGNLGIAYKGMGDYDKAIASHQQALTLMRQLKNRQGEGQILGNLGNAYESLGNYDKAIESYQQSLTIAQEVKDRTGEGAALGNLGAIYANQGKYDQAIEAYQKSLAIAQAVGDKAGQANTLNNLGIAYQVKGDAAKAIDYYTQSLTLARAIGDRQLEARTLGGLGLTYEDQRDYPKAIANQQQTLKIAQAIGDRQLEALAFNNLGHALFSANNLPEAEKQLREALTAFESLRPGLTDADNVSIFDTQVFSYNLLQQILIAAKKPEAALEVSERGRARAFVELLGQRLSPQAAQNYKTKAPPPSIAQIQNIAKTQKATLVEYAIIPDDDFKFQGKLRGPSSKLFIWVVQPTGQVAFRQVDLKNLKPLPGEPNSNTSASLEDLVRASRNLTGPYAERSESVRKQLYQLLIDPIAEFLPKDPSERVVFIPHETLFLLPFPALQDASGQYLIQKHTILTAPAIQILDLTHQQQQSRGSQTTESLEGKNALVVGNPKMPAELDPLPAAEREAREIAQLLHTQAITGEQATKISIVKQMAQARLMHFATHGLLDDIKKLGVPGAIALAPSPGDEGYLTAGELLNLKLNADLVVLSACNTGRGKITGDGVIGLSRSLISAGTPSVIVSLWSVPDAPTALLMTELYRNLKQNPDKAQALRQAMLTTMKQQPNPYNWAAFTLVGEAD